MSRASAVPPLPWSSDDFLAWERQQPEKYEYVDGVVRMMVGGTLDHNRIALNIAARLVDACGDGPCQAFMEGVKVSAASAILYPDVVVTCTPVMLKDDVVREPVIIFEVLSRSTESFDRGAKWVVYQTIPSLQQYVLVAQDSVRVEVFARRKAAWEYTVLEDMAGSLPLTAAGLTLSISAIYQGSSIGRRLG